MNKVLSASLMARQVGVDGGLVGRKDIGAATLGVWGAQMWEDSHICSIATQIPIPMAI